MSLNQTNTQVEAQREFCDVSLEEYICLASELIGANGPMWKCMVSQDTTFKVVHDTLSSYIYDYNQFICKARDQANPCTADCRIDDWLTIFGASDCLKPEQKTLENLCKLYSNRNGFDCEQIKCLAEISGYDVLSCECDNSIKSVAVEEPKCLTGLGSLLPFVGSCISTHNLECERITDQTNCVDCCPPDNLDIVEQFVVNPCLIERNRGGCACEKNKAFSLPFVSDTDPIIVEELCSPWTINIVLAGANPCSTFAIGDQAGSLILGDPDYTFGICLIDRLKPAHICVNYVFEKTCT